MSWILVIAFCHWPTSAAYCRPVIKHFATREECLHQRAEEREKLPSYDIVVCLPVEKQ